jgi:hypothetical protein
MNKYTAFAQERRKRLIGDASELRLNNEQSKAPHPVVYNRFTSRLSACSCRLRRNKQRQESK